METVRTKSTTRIQLDEEHRNAICRVAAAFPEIRKVVLLGSRAMGTADRGSDIDLAIIGPNISHATRLRFHDYLNQQTLIPFFVDVLDYQTLTHAELRRHIETHGVVLYEHT